MKHERKGLNRALFWLYEGHGDWPFRFRWAMLVFDFVTIAYFMWAPFEQRGQHHVWLDYAIGIVIALDLLA
ncbi:MAG: ion transporter, partial [Hyphomonas sp.]